MTALISFLVGVLFGMVVMAVLAYARGNIDDK